MIVLLTEDDFQTKPDIRLLTIEDVKDWEFLSFAAGVFYVEQDKQRFKTLSIHRKHYAEYKGEIKPFSELKDLIEKLGR